MVLRSYNLLSGDRMYEVQSQSSRTGPISVYIVCIIISKHHHQEEDSILKRLICQMSELHDINLKCSHYQRTCLQSRSTLTSPDVTLCQVNGLFRLRHRRLYLVLTRVLKPSTHICCTSACLVLLYTMPRQFQVQYNHQFHLNDK